MQRGLSQASFKDGITQPVDNLNPNQRSPSSMRDENSHWICAVEDCNLRAKSQVCDIADLGKQAASGTAVEIHLENLTACGNPRSIMAPLNTDAIPEAIYINI
jgi:hypothetical protein